MSAAGLVGVLIWNLWSAMAVAENRARNEARQQAEFTATKLCAAFADPRVLDVVPATARFAIQAGEVVVPPEVAWLVVPKLPRFDDLDALLQEKLDQVAQSEPGPAKKLLETLIANEPDGAQRDWLRAEGAWFAHRTQQAQWRDALLSELDAERGGAAPAATILLHAEVDGSLPDWAADRLTTLPVNIARPLLRRLGEKRIDVTGLTEKLEATLAKRETLLTVRGNLPVLGNLESPVMHPTGGQLLLFQGSVAGGGRGALLTRDQITNVVAELESKPWAAIAPGSHTTLVASESETASTVIPGFLALAQRARPTTRLTGPLGLGILLVALALLSGTGLVFLFRSLRREAEAARVRSEFLTMVTHELKTPLAGIRLLSEMLQDGHVRTKEQHQDYYTRLTSESVRLSMLIENVLDLGRMERGERAYDFQRVGLGDVVGEAAELFAPIAEREHLELRVSSETDAEIDADRHALLQSLLNVMDNARKYAASGGKLDVTARSNGTRQLIAIRDYGPGIPAGDRDEIFSRFRRGSEHKNGSIPGVGLGLHLARTIALAHGGSLDVTAPDDGGPGACFVFSLPTRRPEER